MKQKNNFRQLTIVYIFMVVIIVLIGVLGIIGMRRIYLNPEEYHRIMVSNSIAIFAAIAGSVIIALYMRSYIAKKINGLKRYAERMSDYNLSEDIEGLGDDEFGRTIKSINDAQYKLKDVIAKLKDDTESISESSRDTAISIRKSYEQIEAINIRIIKYTEKLSPEELQNSRIAEIKGKMRDTERELEAIAQYLGQIAITADYQKEISETYQKQLDRFQL